MKQFLKYTLATVVGLLITFFFLSIVGVISLAGIAAADGAKPDVKDKSILHIKLSGALEERYKESPFSTLLGNDNIETHGLDNLLVAIRVAKSNSSISGIYIEAGTMTADAASLQELRKALLDFKTSKKFILAYGDNISQGSYYVASVADSIYVNPTAMLDWHGLASQTIFYKDFLDKLGIKMQVFRVGTYKSFVEPFTRTDMSDANREQLTAVIGSLWRNMLTETAASRHLRDSTLSRFANDYAVFKEAADYKKAGLADDVCYIDNVRDKLKSMAKTEKLSLVTPEDLAKLDDRDNGSDQVAVLYAYGEIVDKAAAGLSTEHQIVGQQLIDEMDKLATDKDVKAVVLRINSGGGSAAASEQMWHAVQMLRKVKPVVISMGGMAASGGYYLSCGGDYIIADPTTITGSIGIFGMIPDVSPLLCDKLGLHSDVVKTNDASDFGNYMRPFNAGESTALQNYVNRGYSTFLQRVAAGRKMKVEEVDRIAQGRVWTGEQAIKLKLVDKLGTLDDAILKASQLAKLKNYSVAEYPAEKNWMESLLDESKDNYMEREMKSMFGLYYQPIQVLKSIQSNSRVQARLPYMLNLNL